MSEPVSVRRSLSHRSNSGIGRMLVLSLVLHALLFAVMGGILVPRFQTPEKPVYYVDLLQKPVAKPRSGRPDAPAAGKKKPQTKKTPTVQKPAVPPAPTTPAKPVVQAPSTPATPKAPAKPQAQPTVTKPVVTPSQTTEQRYEEETLSAIEQLKRRQRIEQLKNELNALATQPTPTTDVNAPVGVVGGTGDEAGVDFESWIKQFLSAAWALPSHYHQRGLVAKMALQFNAGGQLMHYEMLSPSGDSFFDASVKRAVQQLAQLPTKPQRPFEVIVTFDPKEMLQ